MLPPAALAADAAAPRWSSYIASTSGLNRSYIRLRLTLRVGVTGSPSSSGSSAFGRMRNALICSTRASWSLALSISRCDQPLARAGCCARLVKPV